MIQINILWQDLNENMHQRLAKALGEDILKHHNNWDVIPLAICEINDERDIVLDSWTGDEGI